MISTCPGSVGIKGTPTLKIKKCPQCGEEIELFSSETSTSCLKCGFVAYNDTMTCIYWCRYVKECVGEELYNQFMNKPGDEPAGAEIDFMPYSEKDCPLGPDERPTLN